ncbi:MAG TPA: hypothetical protein VHB79_00635 [Polyangiaceae bacterium]|nr:hypothetical protein [Polyangiaceae bacterium]
MAGYSGTPLPQKLGIKPQSRVALAFAPGDFAKALGPLPPGVKPAAWGRARGPFDVIVAFFESAAAFEKELPKLHAALESNGGLWAAWPKKASGVATDMTEDVVRKHALPRGLVDNKVCAIDATWSGLRLVIRVEQRAPKTMKAASTTASNKRPSRK